MARQAYRGFANAFGGVFGAGAAFAGLIWACQGIPDIEMALKDGYTTGAGMGLGLGGSKRLVNDFSIESETGNGTKITVVRWK